MRNEELRNRDNFDIVDPGQPLHDGLASILAEMAPARAQSERAVPDMPAAAGGLLIASYLGPLGAAAATIATDGKAAFAIVISLFYLAMFVGVPIVFLKMEKDPTHRPSFDEFMERGIETATGPISGAGALVQMLIVPVLLAFALLTMGLVFLAS